jgi:S1-C subfamily serine protease
VRGFFQEGGKKMTLRATANAVATIAFCAALTGCAPEPKAVTVAPDRHAGAADNATTAEFRDVVQHAKNKVFPAVVYIKCLVETHESGKKITHEVTGSGVLISPKGELLTNWHVIDKATEVRCLLFDGRAFDAKVVGSDKDTDLALVQLVMPPSPTTKSAGSASQPAAPEIPYAHIGDSSLLKEGDFVMAMGAPWGMSRSVSIGIVSATRRFLPGHSEYSLWLQTDASISPGNSGGPLVNTDGEVIGINTRGVTSGGDIGFAIPSATIAQLVPQLRDHGRVNWSWCGLQLQPLRDFERNMYFEGVEGVIVAETDPESPARRAGVQARDRIMRVDGKPVRAITEEDLPALRITLGCLEKSKPVELSLLRDGATVSVKLEPREKGKVEGDELDCPRWDMTVKTINQFDNPDLYWHRNKGVFVYGVKYPGNAQSAGLVSQDIILQIEGQDVATLEDVKAIHARLIENVATSSRARITVLRNGLTRQLVLNFLRDYEKE